MNFTGFTKETLDFYYKINMNNSKNNFENNRELYNQFVKRPMMELYQDLSDYLCNYDSSLCFVPSKCISSPFADQRFSKSKQIKE